MKILLKTKLLVVSAILLSGVALWEMQPDLGAASELPSIVAVDKNELVRIELTEMGNTITLEKQGEKGVWMETAPLNGVADLGRIQSMVVNFRKEIEMDVLVEANPANEGKAYGLDASNGITVEMWFKEDASPSVSFVLGKDSLNTASFLRLTGSSKVYRANVGGRRRFAYSAGDWLNQRLLQLEMSEVQSLTVDGDVAGYTLENGEQWHLQEIDENVDVQKLVQALQSLLIMRIAGIPEESEQSTSFERPWIRLRLVDKAGGRHQLDVLSTETRQALVRVDEGQIYRVPVLPLERFSYGAAYFLDQHVWTLGTREDLDLIRFKTELSDIIIQQDLSNGFWKVLQPSNLDLEMRDLFFMVNTLLSLSSTMEVAIPEQDPRLTLEIRLLNGQIARLFVFERSNDGKGYICQVEGATGAFVVGYEDIERIINGFGQSNIF